jgi:hypothetical protein
MGAFLLQSHSSAAMKFGPFEMRDRGHGVPIKAFHDVDEGRRAVMRQV